MKVVKTMACNYCKADIYVKTIQYTKPIIAPLTRVGELQQELQDLTGEVYLRLPNEFCPMCGRKKEK